ncbi:MOSC domain-containing protein [Arhodomonas sp. AD133]|uniref:MOSC domain-containing protein n=1 Tax=Arhodomonas sp. AD133 TaxID=3415009 RepID=UPI003EBB5D2D
MTEQPVLEVTLDDLRLGGLTPLGARGVPSGIRKGPVAAARLEATGLVGDHQGDTRHHGGAEKALHHYARDHYAAWRHELPLGAGELAAAGAFGENLSTAGVTEEDVCVGDVWAGEMVVLQVSQARQPCWRLNARFGVADMARRVQASGRTGWYYRVLEPGDIRAGETLRLVERPHPRWPLARLIRVLYRDRHDRAALAEMADLPALCESWRAIARKRLDSGRVEDWSRRLTGQ